MSKYMLLAFLSCLCCCIGLPTFAQPEIINPPLPVAEVQQSEDAHVQALQELGARNDPNLTAYMLEALRDPSPRVRITALQVLAQVRSPKLLEVGPTVLRDADAGVRRTATTALDALRDSRTVSLLLGALSDSDIAVRRQAVRAMASLGDPRTVTPLVRLLRDPSPTVAAEAALALGATGDTHVVESLLDALHAQDADQRYCVARALGQLQPPEALAPLQALLNTERDSGVRRQIVWALGQYGGQAAQALLPLLHDDEVRIRARAAEGLGHARIAEAVVPLLAIVQAADVPLPQVPGADTDMRWSVRAVDPAFMNQGIALRPIAIEALGRIGDTRAVAPLLAAVHDATPEVRRAAIAALPAFADPRIAPALQAVLPSEPSAADALARLGKPGAQVLLAAIDISDAVVRAGVLSALGRMHDARAVPALIAALADPAADVRAAAACALQEIADPRAAPALDRAMQDADARVSVYAAWALARLGNARGEEMLLALATELKGSTRVVATTALADVRDPRAADLLVRALADDPPVRAAALRGLARRKDSRAVPALLAALQDTACPLPTDDPYPREVAAMLLAACKERRAIDPLIAAMQTGYPRARQAALNALTVITGKAFGPDPDRWRAWRAKKR